MQSGRFRSIPTLFGKIPGSPKDCPTGGPSCKKTGKIRQYGLAKVFKSIRSQNTVVFSMVHFYTGNEPRRVSDDQSAVGAEHLALSLIHI